MRFIDFAAKFQHFKCVTEPLELQTFSLATVSQSEPETE